MSNGIWLQAAIIAALGATGVGCGTVTVCDDAVDKLVGECELGGGAALSDEIGECVDYTECLAKCVNKSSCNDITNTPAQGGKYYECVARCQTTTP